MIQYIFDKKTHEIIRCDNLIEWSNFLAKTDTRVKLTEINKGINSISISTVFLGLDHSFDNKTPILFETMVFGLYNLNDNMMERYSSWKEAEEGHDIIVTYVEKHIKSISPIQITMNLRR